MPTRFTGIPAVPQTGVDEWNARMLSAIKENVELLTGTRGEGDNASRALTKSNFSVNAPPAQQMTNVSASGAGAALISSFELTGPPGGPFTVNVTGRANVPVLEDYNNLVVDVQALANDVAALRATVEILITQLRS